MFLTTGVAGHARLWRKGTCGDKSDAGTGMSTVWGSQHNRTDSLVWTETGGVWAGGFSVSPFNAIATSLIVQEIASSEISPRHKYRSFVGTVPDSLLSAGPCFSGLIDPHLKVAGSSGTNDFRVLV